MKRLERNGLGATFLRSAKSLCLAAVMGVSILAAGCAEHHYEYRYYDPYYHDYHEWRGGEVEFYQRWAIETHRDPHRDFRKLSHEEQREYWQWRHNH